jgi:hypothetical protein
MSKEESMRKGEREKIGWRFSQARRQKAMTRCRCDLNMTPIINNRTREDKRGQHEEKTERERERE